MGQPAARLSDPAGHGGVISMGSVTVMIGGMPAARIGDLLICPGFDGPKPHIMGNITMASTTVIIDGAFAARLGDPTGCGAAGVSGKGMPPLAGPPPAAPVPGSFNEEGAVWGDEKSGFLYHQYNGYENDLGGQRAVKGSIERISGEHVFDSGKKVSGSLDGITGSAEGHVGIFSAGASGQVAVVSGQARVTDPDGESMGAQGGILTAQAGVDALLGTDGRRSGIAFGAGAQASAVEGQLEEVEVYDLPFTDSTMSIGGIFGASLGVGAAANAGVYDDKADDRFHIMGMVDGELFIGIKLALDISFGQPSVGGGGGGGGTPGIPVPLTPGTILAGCPTVLIG